MQLYYQSSKLPRVLVQVGDQVSTASGVLLVKTLPAQVGDLIILEQPGGNFQDYDFDPIAVGMVWL